MLKVLLWNKKEDGDARFVIQDDDKGYTEYAVSNPKDVTWVKDDISKEDDYKEWMPFDGTEVPSLDYLMM